MDQPSTQDHNALQKDLNARREAYTHQLTDLIEKRDQAEQGIHKPLTQKQLDNLNIYQGLIQEIDKNLQGTNQFSRAFGKVLSSSGIATDPKHGNTADWALVDLNMNRFNQRPKNIVPDFEFTSNQLTALNSKLGPRDIFTPQTADTHLTTHVKLQEALNHTTMDTDGFPTFRVMKYGRTTHWTAGVSNELWSDCQREPGRITTEWCILDLPSYGRFSEGGDSGSIVFDYKGRIVGVLHGGGAPKSVGMDMTYITPIEWLFENIEKTLGATVDLD